MKPLRPDWIAVDWGTSRLRASAMCGDTEIAKAEADTGAGKLAPEAFEPALLALIDDWLTTANGTLPVFVCGMAGARGAWIEAASHAVPCTPLAAGTVDAPSSDPRIAVRIQGGLFQSRPADVIRGEETQIAGFLAHNPGFDGVLCLPGSHSKWAHVSAGEVVSFQTFMTGELFAALAQHSILHRILSKTGWDDDAFANAVSETLSRPERLAGLLFSVRAEALLDGLDGEAARARLSGLLIGAELAASRAYWLGQPVAVIGSGSLARPYIAALRAQGTAPVQADGSAMARAGLAALRRLAMEENQ